MKLTARTATGEKLPAGKVDHLLFDDAIPGFGLRLRAGGSRVWVYQYKVGSQQRRMVIGKVRAIPADKARQIATDLYAKVRLGSDPAHDKKMARSTAVLTFGSIADQFLAWQKARMRPRSYVETERHILKNAKPLLSMPMAAVDRATIAVRLREITDHSGPVQANRTRSTLAALFVWAMKEGLADNNPAANTNKHAEQSRERVLADAELSAIWNALEADQYGAIIKLLILTGQRREEIGGLRWVEIHFSKDVIDLPSGRTKNKRPHQIPMSGMVSAILQAQAKIEKREFVFGHGVGPFQSWADAKTKLDKRIAASAGSWLAPWTVHDLRRTCATRMADLGVQPHIVEATLNHISGHRGGIAGVYNRAVYGPEKAQALALWATHVAAAVEGRAGNVTPLRAAP